MGGFFNSIYYYTNGFYSVELDNYLYALVSGYLHIGLFMVICSLVISVIYYYLLAPVRRQTFWWFVYAGINAVINFIFALWYTMTPLINNAVGPNQVWSGLDCVMFGVTNILWSVAFFVLWSLIVKWKSTAKYIPFQKF